MRYLDVCAGISAPTVAWQPLGWKCVAHSEIEAAPRAILRHHYPDTPLHGRERAKGESLKQYGEAAGFQTIGADEYGAIDLLVGGTPCQSFSIAGLRRGLGDDRGNLALEYVRLADRKRPRWLLWENVPGVLSSHKGRDFGTFLGALAQLGYGFAYRVLDAKHFGVPQQRRRVFVVGYLGDWRPPAAVLFERESLFGHPTARVEAQQGPASRAGDAAKGGSGKGGYELVPQGCGGEIAPTFNAEFGSKLGLDNQHIDSGAGLFVRDIMGTVTARMFNALGARDVEEGALIPVGFDAYNQTVGDISKTVASRHDQDTASLIVQPRIGVRRLSPREVERLFGFPDDYTLIPYRGRMMGDGPRYKALGNSMAVPVLRWLGSRINTVDALLEKRMAA